MTSFVDDLNKIDFTKISGLLKCCEVECPRDAYLWEREQDQQECPSDACPGEGSRTSVGR